MAERPDIVLVMTDQQRHDQIGYASDGPLQTPTIDALAAAGVVFETAYSGSTTCVPARTSLMTGLLDHRAPYDAPYALHQGTWTLAHALRAAGYETALIGKMHFSPIRADHGFEHVRSCEHLDAYTVPAAEQPELDHYHDWLAEAGLPDWRYEVPKGARAPYIYDEATHPTSWVRDQTIDFLRNRSGDRPLFLVVSFPHPHPPLHPPARYARRYDPDDCVIDPAWASVNDGLPRRFRKLTAQDDALQRRVDPERLPHHRQRLAYTYGLITQIDDALADIVDHLTLERTFLFFTSDHGDFAGHRGLVRKVPWLPFDDLARVPCFATGGVVAGGRREAAPMQSFDFVATALSFAGVEPEQDDLDARDLRGVLTDPAASVAPDRTVFSAISMRCPMARRGRYKYIRLLGWGQEVLFDVETDPEESVNLIGGDDVAEIHAELSAAVDREVAVLKDRPGP
ncbi:MAG: sulfatase-like hydrolase/transferase [Acidimicrobiia bacterium]|nr:sulfatase-like hydrolase/transferase [Acidimicrobiia bacterium]